MLAGNEAAGVWQGPVKVLVASDVDAALALYRHAQRAAVRQARLVLDSKRQAHRRLLLRSINLAVDPEGGFSHPVPPLAFPGWKIPETHPPRPRRKPPNGLATRQPNRPIRREARPW